MRLEITRLRSIIIHMLIVVVSFMTQSCATFVAYSGPKLPDLEVAMIECYWRYYFVYIESCQVTAIDGRRRELAQLFGITSKVKPGQHWVEVSFERYFGGGGGVTDVCAFDLEMKAGYSYKIRAHSLKTDVSWLSKYDYSSFYTGWLDLDAVSSKAEQETQTIKAACSFGGGSMCREVSDCSPHPDMRCIRQDGFRYGHCGFEER